MFTPKHIFVFLPERFSAIKQIASSVALTHSPKCCQKAVLLPESITSSVTNNRSLPLLSPNNYIFIFFDYNIFY